MVEDLILRRRAVEVVGILREAVRTFLVSQVFSRTTCPPSSG